MSWLKESVVEWNNISEEDFQIYEDVRMSGITNMFDIKMVEELSVTLDRDTIITIMKHYGDLMKKYPNVVKSSIKESYYTKQPTLALENYMQDIKKTAEEILNALKNERYTWAKNMMDQLARDVESIRDEFDDLEG